jgi:hypothetical protein
MSDNKHMPTVELLHLAKVLEHSILDQENSPKQRKITRSCGFFAPLIVPTRRLVGYLARAPMMDDDAADHMTTGGY